MPICVYETIPARTGEKPKCYEIQQSMTDEPLATHPETGERIRRVILGGLGIFRSTAGGRIFDNAESGKCGPGCCCG